MPVEYSVCNGLNSLWVHGASTAQLINLSRLLGCIDGKELDCGLNEGALPRNKTLQRVQEATFYIRMTI